MKENKKIKLLNYLVIGLLAITGIILYLASYFQGLLLILAGLIYYGIYTTLRQGKKTTIDQVRKAGEYLFIPLAGMTIAILAGAVIMLITGYNPLSLYKALFYGGFVKNWHISVLNATPLIFTGLAVAFAFRAGLFNIGAEGQYYIGAMAATFLGLKLNLPSLLTLPLIFLFAGFCACLFNIIPAFLKVKTGAHEVITTIMLAHIARYSTSIFIRAFGGDPATSTHAYVTDAILPVNWLPRFQQFLPRANYRVHTGILIAIAFALFVHYLINYTHWGFEIRAVGHNPGTARTQGISVKKNIFLALLFSGFLAGLGGANQILGLDHKMFENLNAGYGWNGISVALLASNNPLGIVFTSLLWGALDAGGQYMARTMQTPNSIVEIIKGIILFMVVARYLWRFLQRRWFRKNPAGVNSLS